MEGAMLYRKFPAYNSNVSSAIPSDNLVRSMRSFTIPITTNFGLFSQMLKVTLETFSVRRETLDCESISGISLWQEAKKFGAMDDFCIASRT